MTSNPPSAPSDQDDLRERVLRASVELIEEQGLGALSMREVARRAGVSHQAPYHYFEDREAILAAVAERGFQMLEERLRAARAEANGATHAVELAGVAYIQFAYEQPAHFRMMFRPELVNVPSHHDLDCTASQAFCHVPELISACFEAGLPTDFGMEPMSAFLWSSVHGFACLLLDGTLGEKLPSMRERDKAVRDITRTVRRLIDAAIGEGKTKRPARKSRSRK